MTKKEVSLKINEIIRRNEERTSKEIDDILVEEDMWYGQINETNPLNIVNEKDTNKRNGDLYFQDGVLEESVGVWLHRRDEIFK